MTWSRALLEAMCWRDWQQTYKRAGTALKASTPCCMPLWQRAWQQYCTCAGRPRRLGGTPPRARPRPGSPTACPARAPAQGHSLLQDNSRVQQGSLCTCKNSRTRGADAGHASSGARTCMRVCKACQVWWSVIPQPGQACTGGAWIGRTWSPSAYASVFCTKSGVGAYASARSSCSRSSACLACTINATPRHCIM